MSYWILQSNPNTYRQIDYMRAHWNEPDTWAISRYVDEVKVEDIAFIWLSNKRGKSNRGIYAIAKITGLPTLGRNFERGDPFWIDKEEQKRLSVLPRLELQYLKPLFDSPLLVNDLKAATLGSLLILRMPQRAIYKLTDEEGGKIKRTIGLP
ncbi:hypothetical protein ES703_61914 [subsurface metagenome]